MKAYLQKRNSGDLFDVFEDFFKPMFYDEQLDSMRTDIRETDKEYQLSIEMPGFKKEEIKVSLENGYLTVSAAKGLDKDEKDQKGKYIRQERYAGAMSRSFYIGEEVSQDEIRAKYENGILRLTIPKKDAKPAVEEKKHIAIEG